jgi:hypothetical protein
MESSFADEAVACNMAAMNGKYIRQSRRSGKLGGKAAAFTVAWHN